MDEYYLPGPTQHASGITMLASAVIISNPILVPTLDPQSTYRGSGQLSGEFPDGITTVEGAPVSARVRAYWENPEDGVLYPVGDVTSDASGVWQLDGVIGGRQYLVRGSLSGHRDVLAQGVYPKDDPRFSAASKQVFVGVALNYKLPVIGGRGTKTLALTAGTLPSGVTLTGSTLSGSWPTGATGEYPLTFSITDDTGTYSAAFTLVLALLPLSLQGNAGDLILGTPFSCTFAALGGEGPYTYSVTAGALPAGLSLDSSSGVLSGTPTASGAYSYTITATDVRSGTVEKSFSGKVLPEVFWDKVAFLIPGDTLASGKIDDKKGNAWAETGALTLDASNTLFGKSTLLANNHQAVLTGSNVVLGADDFTIELHLRLSNNTIQQNLIGVSDAVFQLYVMSGYLRVWNSQDLISTPISTGVFYHCAIVRKSGVTTLYVDGVSKGSTTNIGNLAQNTYRISPWSGGVMLGVNFANFRMTRGVARYSSNFTPPSAPFPYG